MRRRFSKLLLVSAIVSGLLTSYSVFAFDDDLSPEEKIYDRLDGHGKSGVNADVIEWEDNLEIHVRPKTALKKLSAVIHSEDGKKVMVLGYDFGGGRQIIRRYIMGIPLSGGFKAYINPKENGKTKIVLSMSKLDAPYVPFPLVTNPGQLYPDGHPKLKSAPPVRGPASVEDTIERESGTAARGDTIPAGYGAKPHPTSIRREQARAPEWNANNDLSPAWGRSPSGAPIPAALDRDSERPQTADGERRMYFSW